MAETDALMAGAVPGALEEAAAVTTDDGPSAPAAAATPSPPPAVDGEELLLLPPAAPSPLPPLPEGEGSGSSEARAADAAPAAPDPGSSPPDAPGSPTGIAGQPAAPGLHRSPSARQFGVSNVAFYPRGPSSRYLVATGAPWSPTMPARTGSSRSLLSAAGGGGGGGGGGGDDAGDRVSPSPRGRSRLPSSPTSVRAAHVSMPSSHSPVRAPVSSRRLAPIVAVPDEAPTVPVEGGVGFTTASDGFTLDGPLKSADGDNTIVVATAAPAPVAPPVAVEPVLVGAAEPPQKNGGDTEPPEPRAELVAAKSADEGELGLWWRVVTPLCICAAILAVCLTAAVIALALVGRYDDRPVIIQAAPEASSSPSPLVGAVVAGGTLLPRASSGTADVLMVSAAVPAASYGGCGYALRQFVMEVLHGIDPTTPAAIAVTGLYYPATGEAVSVSLTDAMNTAPVRRLLRRPADSVVLPAVGARPPWGGAAIPDALLRRLQSTSDSTPVRMVIRVSIAAFREGTAAALQFQLRALAQVSPTALAAYPALPAAAATHLATYLALVNGLTDNRGAALGLGFLDSAVLEWSPTPTVTLSPSPTATLTTTASWSATPTVSATATWTATPSATHTWTASLTPSPTRTPSTTPSPHWASHSGSGVWTSVGASSSGGVVVGVANGTIYVSTDAGLNWRGPAALPGTAVCVAADAAGATLAAAVVEPPAVWVSTDSGNVWSRRASLPARVWNTVAVAPDGSAVVAGAANDTLYTAVAGDDYTLFSPVTGAGAAPAWAAVAVAASGAVLAAATNGTVVYATGVSAPFTHVPAVALAPAPWSAAAATSGILALAASPGGLWLSTDGTVWTSTAASPLPWSAVVASTDGLHIAAAARSPFEALYTTDDGGATWHTDGAAGARDFRALAMTPDGRRIFAAADSLWASPPRF